MPSKILLSRVVFSAAVRQAPNQHCSREDSKQMNLEIMHHVYSRNPPTTTAQGLFKCSRVRFRGIVVQSALVL